MWTVTSSLGLMLASHPRKMRKVRRARVATRTMRWAVFMFGLLLLICRVSPLGVQCAEDCGQLWKQLVRGV